VPFVASGEQRPKFSVVDDQDCGFGLFFPWKSWTNLMWETTLHQPVGLGMTGSPSYPHLLIQKAKDDPIEP
jgi:hypothetical protein